MKDSSGRPDPRPEHLLVPRSQLTGTLVSTAGWLVVIIPIIAFSAVVFAAVTNPSSGLVTAGKTGLMLLGVVLLFCMIAAPHLLGQAVIHRERTLWKAALWTGIPAVGVILYLAGRWLVHL